MDLFAVSVGLCMALKGAIACIVIQDLIPHFNSIELHWSYLC